MKRTVNVLSNLNWGTRACAVLALCATTAIALPAQTLTTLFSFDGTDGAVPQAGLVQATNGDLYGTSSFGGANNLGTVFKITPSGTLTTLYSFCSQSGCPDGYDPYAGLVQATNGDLYGTTLYGGANGPYGTLFRITTSGTLTTLYSFCSQSGCTDGELPLAPLVQAANGDLYGTTAYGGVNGLGTVFRVTPSGTLTTLYSFCSQSGCPDGYDPYAGLVQATSGDFYGTTVLGGTGGWGTVFKITSSGTLMTLYSFCPKAGATANSPWRWSRPPMGTSTGQPRSARFSKSPRAARRRRCTPSAQKAVARMVKPPTRGSSRPPMGTSTGQPLRAGPTALAQSSKSP